MVAIPITQTDLHHRVLDNINTSVMLFNEDLVLIYANPAAEMLLGASSRRLIGMRFDEMISAPEPILDQILEAVKTAHPFSHHEQTVSLMNEKEVTVDFTVNIFLVVFLPGSTPTFVFAPLKKAA